MNERKVYLTNLKNEIVKFVRENNVTLSSAKVEIISELDEHLGNKPHKFVLPIGYTSDNFDFFISMLDFDFDEITRIVKATLLFTDGSWATRESTVGGIAYYEYHKRPNEFTNEDML